MATNTKNYNFKKPDESDFYDIQDQNGNWDIADEKLEELGAPTFEDYSGTTSVPEASAAIEAIKSKKKIPEILANIKAAFKGVCLLGHIVNNCVTDNSKLPLSAAQGKALMDQITKLNSELWPRNSGTIIQNGTDMHTIKTPGYYCCTSNATAVTLKNCPFTEAFTLVVYWSTGYPGAYLSQEYTHYIGNRRAIQNYNADTAVWKKYEFQITMK